MKTQGNSVDDATIFGEEYERSEIFGHSIYSLSES